MNQICMKAKEHVANLTEGVQITSREILEYYNEGEGWTPSDVKAVSSVLCFATKKGILKRNGRSGRNVVYLKIEKAKEKKLANEEFSMLYVGQSILAVIDDLKRQITEKNELLKQRATEFQELLEENTQLKKVYAQAQDKIIQLNKNGHGKTIKLSELRELRDVIPHHAA